MSRMVESPSRSNFSLELDHNNNRNNNPLNSDSKISRHNTPNDGNQLITSALADYVTQYEQWVSSHEPLARNVENLLYILPQFLPSQLGDTAISTEMVYSAVGLMKLYHDYIMSKVGNAIQLVTNNNRLLRLPLTFLAHTQVTFEAIMGKFGDKAVWNMILAIEVVKCVLKSIMSLQEKNKILCRGGQYISSEDTSSSQASIPLPLSHSDKTQKTTPKNIIAPYIHFNDALCTTSNVMLKTQQFGELCHIVRPVCYALLRRLKGSQSWMPVTTSFTIEVLGIICSIASSRSDHSSSHNVSDTRSCRVTDEISRRKLALCFYLLRNPIFLSYTKPAADQLCRNTATIPLVGRLVAFAIQHGLCYYQQYHFYTAASS